jgi:hypothetical protein
MDQIYNNNQKTVKLGSTNFPDPRRQIEENQAAKALFETHLLQKSLSELLDRRFYWFLLVQD